MRGEVDPRESPVWIADRPVWLNADRTVAVEQGDPRAKHLLCSAGKAIPLETAQKYGVYADLPGPETVAEPVVDDGRAVPGLKL